MSTTAAEPSTSWSAVGSPTLPEPTRRRRERTWRFVRGPAYLLAPAAIVIGFITGYPLVQLVLLSFHKYGWAQVFGRPPEFVGFDNYIAVLTDDAFWAVLGRSVAFCAACVVATMSLGIAVAILMSRLGRGMRGLVSIGLVLAWAMPPLSATTIGGWLFDTRRGVVNYVITQVTGVDFTGHSWLNKPWSFFFVATLIITWQSVPFVAFTTYAALTQVPGEVLEAASLDGTSGFQRFRLIVVPYIRSVLLVLLVLQIIWDMRVFTQVYALQTIGGNYEETNTIGVYIYQISTGSGDLGAGGAISVILVVLMLAISGYYIRSLLREEGI